jgi:excisionase family DNA binding protein
MASNAPDTIAPELLTTAEAARLLGIGERTLWRHSRSGAAPAPLKIGGTVRYSRQELLDWVRVGCPRVDALTPTLSQRAREKGARP